MLPSLPPGASYAQFLQPPFATRRGGLTVLVWEIPVDLESRP